MSTPGGLGRVSRWPGFPPHTSTFTVVIAIILVPCFFVQNPHPGGVSGSPSVSRVTAYSDPYWKIRGKLRITTSTASPLVNPHTNSHEELQVLPEFRSRTKRPITRLENGNEQFESDNIHSVYANQYPHTLYIPFSHRRESFPSPLILAQNQNPKVNKKKRRKRPTFNRNSTPNTPWKRLLPTSEPTQSQQVENLSVDSAKPNWIPRRYRRRRLTKRRKTRNRYFRPEANINEDGGGESEETENVVTTSVEPLEVDNNYPIVASESVDNEKFVRPPSLSLSSSMEYDEFWRHRQQEELLESTRNPDDPILTTIPTSIPKTTTINKMSTTTSENGGDIVKPMYLSSKPKIRMRIRRRRKKIKDQVENQNEDNQEGEKKKERREEEETLQPFDDDEGNGGAVQSDLHSSESFNPFLNSSTPFSNDLRNSLFNNLDLLHPLFNSDTSLKDVYKVPENKTIGIRHMLSDEPMAVQVAPDLQYSLDDLYKDHSLLNHDSIISSDYDHQVYKNRPQIHVKHSMSMSTTSSSSSTSRPQTTNSVDPIVITTSTKTMTPATRTPTVLRTKSPSILSLSPSPPSSTYKSTSSTTRSRIPTTAIPTDKPSREHDVIFTFPSFYDSGHHIKSTYSSPPPLNPNADSSSTVASIATSRTPLPKTIQSEETRVKVDTTTTRTTPAPSLISSTTTIITTHEPITTLGSKTPFTLRPKILSSSSSYPSPPTPTTKQRYTTVIYPQVHPTSSVPQRQQHGLINTFLDNIDENSGKNTWTPSTPTTTTTTPSTTSVQAQSPPVTASTGRPTEKIKLSKDPPLILMPPFKNDKDEEPITLTTPDPIIHRVTKPSISTNNNNNIINNNVDKDTLLLQQLLADLGVNLAEITESPSTLKTTTTPTTTASTTTTTTTTTTSTTTKKPTKRPTRPTTQRPTTTTQQSNDLFGLFNLFAPQTPAPVTRSPLNIQTTSKPSDFFNIFNLFQPSTPPPTRQVVTTAAPDLFNLFNLFQPTTPPPARNNDLFGLFNLFAPQTTTTRPPPRATAPANDFLSLLNLFQAPAQPQQQQHHQQQQRQAVKPTSTQPSNPQSELEVLVQQALLESLGVKTGGANFGQASNVNQQLVASPNGQKQNEITGGGGLTDDDLKSIYAIIDRQQGKTSSSTPVPPPSSNNTINVTSNEQGNISSIPTSGTTTTTTTRPPTIITKSTTTLMPIFRNMLNLFGITDPTTAPVIVHPTKHSLRPVYNPLSTTQKPIIKNDSLFLQLFGGGHKTNTTTPTTKAPDTSFDLLTQLLNLGQVVENTKAKPPPLQQVPETSQIQKLIEQQQLFEQQTKQQEKKQQRQQHALDIQSILTQGGFNAATSKPEVTPAESNFFHMIANQFTPKPQKPNGLYYWVDLNAFMGDQAAGNPYDGIRPKLGQKDYFIKVKREASPARTGLNYPPI